MTTEGRNLPILPKQYCRGGGRTGVNRIVDIQIRGCARSHLICSCANIHSSDWLRFHTSFISGNKYHHLLIFWFT